MKVLVVHNRYRAAQPSGENRVVDEEVALLRSAGVSVDVFERSSDEIAGMPLSSKVMVPVHVVWSGRDRHDLARRIRSFGPDVVHIHNTFPLLSPAVLFACADEGVPSVMTLHNFRLACANGLLFRDGLPCQRCVTRSPVRSVWHGCYRGSRVATLPVAAMIAVHRAGGTWSRHVNRFIVPSRFARDLMVRAGLPQDRLVVKPNSTPDVTEPRTGSGEYLLFLGRLETEKGLDLLVRAWRRGAPEIELLVVGDGALRPTVERWARSERALHYLGMRRPDECRDLIRGARAVVVPSGLFETFARVAVEAMAGGVPPIGPAHGAFPELIGSGRDGLLFRPGDVDDLARTLALVAHDDVLATSMGAAARKTYEGRFTPGRSLQQLMTIYDTVVRREVAA